LKALFLRDLSKLIESVGTCGRNEIVDGYHLRRFADGLEFSPDERIGKSIPDALGGDFGHHDGGR